MYIYILVSFSFSLSLSLQCSLTKNFSQLLIHISVLFPHSNNGAASSVFDLALTLFFFVWQCQHDNWFTYYIRLFIFYLWLVINTVGTSHSPVISCWSGDVFHLWAARHAETVVDHLQIKPHKLGLMAFPTYWRISHWPYDFVLWSRPNSIWIGNYSTRDPAGKSVSVRDLLIWRN